MPRSTNLLIVLAIWAAIYLPTLGSLEIKGEEGRRILPAVTMIESGNYLIPQVGSEPYFRKPPLVNWLVAASFKVFRARNEWTARMPSALCVLLVALAFITVARPPLGPNGSLVAAFAWLTNFGIVEKGRLIEIEALYVSLTGLAFICWFAWYQQRRSPWLTWIVPWIFLGLGLLAKGPLHLLFFYAIVAAVLYRRREFRHLFHPAHFVGLLLMLAIFAAWAIPCLQVMHGSNVAHTWSRQFSGRLTGESFKFRGWLMNIPRGCAYLLPWILLFPLAGRVEFVDEQERRNVRGLSWGIVASFVAVSLLPGSLSRYTMPLLAPACCLLAILTCAERLDLPKRLRILGPAAVPAPVRLPAAIAGLVVVAMCFYAVAIVPQLKSRQKVRALATQIDAAVPAGEVLYAIDPAYQPFLFYVRSRIVYASDVHDVPRSAHFLLVQPDGERAVAESTIGAPTTPRPILRSTDDHGRSVILLTTN